MQSRTTRGVNGLLRAGLVHFCFSGVYFGRRSVESVRRGDAKTWLQVNSITDQTEKSEKAKSLCESGLVYLKILYLKERF